MKKRLLSLFAAFAVVLSFSACKPSSASQQIDITSETNIPAQTEAASAEKTDDLSNTENSSDTALSREYEFDLEKYLDNYDKDGLYSLRDELDFLSEEQYEVYLRALIFVDEIEYYRITNTSGTPHWIDENGNVFENYYYLDPDGVTVMLPYTYISSYKSFCDYLRSVFTDSAVDKIMSNDRFYEVNGELYFECGEKGGPIYFQSGQYQLTEKNDDEVIFEYIALQADDENEWTETHTIKLIRTDNGWRSELFEYLKAE